MKRMLSIFIVITLLCTTTLIAAEDTDKYNVLAEKLSSINVFKGTSNGFELGREPTRLEGLVMLIRLLGKEDDALAQDNSKSVFIDVPKWGIAYTNYAFNNGLSNGVGDNLFGSDQVLDGKSFHTFVLRALGYNDANGDFKWSNANEFAKEKNVINEETYSALQSKPLIRGQVAQSSYNALFTKTKDSEVTLVYMLVKSGDIDAEIAKKLIITDEVVKTDEIKVVDNTIKTTIKDSVVKIIDLDKYAEFVKIQNKGTEPINIGGWTMVSEKGSQTFVFPAGYILEVDQICVITSGAIKHTGDFTMAETTIWNNSTSDSAVLLDGNGNEVGRLDN